MENSKVVSSKDVENVEEFIMSLPRAELGGYTLHQYEGFWSTLPVIKSIIYAQKHFQAQNGDIIIATKPKTGTTWLNALVFAVTNRTLHKADSQNHPLRTVNSHRLVPSFEFYLYAENPCPDFTKFKTNPRLFGTHMSYKSLPDTIKSNPSCKVVYICRNPFDTFISYFEFIRSWLNVDETFSMDKVFDGFCIGVDVSGPFYDHVLQYWNMSLEKPQNVLFLKYEDLKEDIDFQLKRLANFLGFPFTAEEEKAGVIQDIANLCSFKEMRNFDVNKTGQFESPPFIFSNRYFFRKGEVGDWVNHFTPEMTERFHKLMKEKLDGTGLSFRISSPS